MERLALSRASMARRFYFLFVNWRYQQLIVDIIK